MTLAANNIKTKKEFKQRAMGKPLLNFVRDVSLTRNDFSNFGFNYVVGPTEYERKWYAQVKTENGIVKLIK